MPNATDRSHVDTVDAAIAEVLLAERNARTAVAQCVVDAEAIFEQAKQQAREIARRAAQRNVRVQRWSAGMLQEQLAKLSARQGPGGADEAGTPEQLQRIVAAMAAELTGGRR